jgi:hypothetical protein
MTRRKFVGAATGAIASTVIGAPAEVKSESKDAKPQAALAAPPPGLEYFTQERLERAIDTNVSLDGIKFEVICYTFNPWHPSPVMEKVLGKGWTEYETMRNARPQFSGHYQPKQPLWGCFNEADPAWSEREIELASSAGIGAFMIDWYWHEGTMFYHEQLEQGLLKAKNREKIKFAVMWANHHWPNCYPAPENGEEAILLPQNYSEADMDRVCEYLIEHYFMQPNYWKLKDRPVFSIFWVTHLIQHFGAGKLRKIFGGWQERARKAGLNGIYFQAAAQYDANTPLTEAGFESATEYLGYAGGPPGKHSPYVVMAEGAIRHWKEQAGKVKVPYYPQAPVGWDNSPRYGNKAHAFVNRTADQYERVLQAAKCFVAAQKINPPLIFIGAWNEWTEDHYLLPDEVHGYSYLEAVKRQFGQT